MAPTFKKSHSAWLTICFLYLEHFQFEALFPILSSNCEIINVIWPWRQSQCNEEKKADFCWCPKLKLNFTSSHGCQLTGFAVVQTRMWCKAGRVSSQDRQVTGGRIVVTGCGTPSNWSSCWGDRNGSYQIAQNLHAILMFQTLLVQIKKYTMTIRTAAATQLKIWK